jgi:hypothetical protein
MGGDSCAALRALFPLRPSRYAYLSEQKENKELLVLVVELVDLRGLCGSRGWRTVVGGRDFLNFEALYGWRGTRELRGIVGYEFGLVGALHFRLVDEAAIEAAIASGELKARSELDRRIVTSQPEALRAFIAASGPSVWRSVPADLLSIRALPATRRQDAPKP